MQRLSNGGRTGVFLGAIAFLLVALFLPGWYGAILLLATIAGLGWVMSKTWPVTPSSTRAFRLIILLALTVMAVVKIV
jgi:hypothetical protein